jgi:hypothetical protein
MASFERLLPLLSCLAFLLQGATALSLPANHAGVTRRALLLGASTGAAASLIGAPVRADEEAPTSIAYADLVRELKTCRDGAICRVSKVAFTTASGETGDAILANGARLPIVGIPVDDPSSDSSPYKLVAKCRDAKVPYTFPFTESLAKYRKS